MDSVVKYESITCQPQTDLFTNCNMENCPMETGVMAGKYESPQKNYITPQRGIRMRLMGKRVANPARSAVTGPYQLDPHELGIPIQSTITLS